MSFHVPEKCLLHSGPLSSQQADGNNGVFILPAIGARRPVALCCIASDGRDWEECGFSPPAWEHVSVSTPARCPTWQELCAVKALFWDDEDVVIQFHPRASEYVNNHPFCLHLWRPIGVEIPTPPLSTVGVL